MFKKKKLPHFLVLGAQKGGTTTLHKLLSVHPKIYMPECKEVHYFSKYADKSIDWYSNHFKDAKWYQKIGDITPYYLYHPKAAERIKKVLPKAKLVVLLRDPVERTISQIFHAKRHGYEKLSIQEALNAEKRRLETNDSNSHQKHSYVDRSKYIEQLDRFERQYTKKNILVLKSETFFQNTERTYDEIQDFIGVKRTKNTWKGLKANAGENESKKIDHEIRLRLRKELAETATKIKQRYGIDWGWCD